MISTKELNLHSSAQSADNPRDFNYARALMRLFLLPPPSLLPDEWAESEPLRFNYSESLKGPCDFTGRNYLRRPIRDAANPAVRKQKKIFGRGNGKTLVSEIKKCYKLKFQPGTRGLCVWPAAQGEGSSTDYVNGRLGKTIEATKCLNDLIPFGVQKRFVINGKKVILNGSSYGFIGAGSGSKGVGNRLNDIDFDEIEKYPQKLKNEGSIINLAEGATKGVADYQIDYSSTPTIEEGLMWQAIQKSNLHLYFLPCPHCSSLAKETDRIDKIKSGKNPVNSVNPVSKLSESERATLAITQKFFGWFIILFSEQYAAGHPRKYVAQGTEDVGLNGAEIPAATVKFRFHATSTKENPVNDARGKDGTWNYERAMANAHIECPHCKKSVTDTIVEDGQVRLAPDRKVWMDAHGAWICVKPGEPGDIGYMINSLYAPVINKESTWGGYAMEFISAIEEGGESVRTFINAILAGVYTNQDTSNKIELGSMPLAQADWIPILTADFQKNHPFLWFVVRKWCAFKLHPPGGITNGVPDFIGILDKPGNEVEKKICLQLSEKLPAAWYAVGELLRFEDSRASAVIDFLIAQKITGKKLHDFYRENGNGLTMDFRRALYRELSMHLSAGKDHNKIRAARGGDSELIATGYCDHSGEYAWDELKEYIQQFEIGKGMPIPGRCVGVDCGFSLKFHREVLQKCHESGSEYKFYDPTVKTRPPMFFRAPRGLSVEVQSNGWFAMRGKPSNKPLGEGKFNYELNTNLEDPYYGTSKAGQMLVEVLEFPSGIFWTHKNNMRLGRTKNTYSVSPNVEFFPKLYTLDGTPTGDSNFKLTDYQRHMNEQFYNEKTGLVEPRHGRGGSQSRAHPYHLDDCENENLAIATYNEFFDSNPSKGEK